MSRKRNKIAACVAAFMLCSVFFYPLAGRAAEPPDSGGAAEAVVFEPGSYTATCASDGDVLTNLADHSRDTTATIYGEDALTIAGDAPFTALYFLWQQPPGSWTLEGDSAARTCGENGFIHEYVELGSPQTEVVLTTAGDAVLCDIFLMNGPPPDWVQVWQPPVEKADLLALPTHADDEHLFFGGTLPTYAGDKGMQVQVVYMTNHWGESYRPHELLDGLWTVGVRSYPIMGPFNDVYSDSLEQAEGQYGRDEVTAFQVEMLRRFQPEVVVAHDINGEYGHGAHQLNASTLLDALEAAPDAAQYPESAASYGTWDTPKAYLHLWPENQITLDWNVPLAAFDGKTGFEMAIEGFARHTSQQGYFSVEADGVTYDNSLYGLVRTTVGPDTAGNDFFENIDLTAADTSEPLPDDSAVSAPPQSSSVPPAAPVSTGGDSDGKGGVNVWALLGIVVLSGVVLFITYIIYDIARRKARKKRRRQHRAAQMEQMQRQAQNNGQPYRRPNDHNKM